MRITVPTLPNYIINAATTTPQISAELATERIAAFVANGNVAVLTGAGVSVDSGIRAYRGKDGLYMNPNYKYVFKLLAMDLHSNSVVGLFSYALHDYIGGSFGLNSCAVP